MVRKNFLPTIRKQKSMKAFETVFRKAERSVFINLKAEIKSYHTDMEEQQTSVQRDSFFIPDAADLV